MNKYMRIAIGIMLLSGLASGQAGRPAAANNVQQTTNVINDCEKRANTFKRSVRLKAKGNVPNLQRDADQLEQAMNKVGDSWNRDHNLQKTRAFVTGAITVGQQINKYMTTFRGDADLANQWAAVRAELNRLAQTFGLPPIRW